ncbi:MAG: SPFH domain-containing protein [Ardenticatenales bacterium]|nr:SPFH domain-containing protein [Ardenticatenales bacterium]
MARTLLLLLTLFTLSGCYFTDVESSQIGIETNRGEVSDIKQAGGHQNLNPFSELSKIDVSAKTLEWSDPDLVTADKQPIGVTIAVTYARKRDRDSILLMWNQYRGEAISDDLLMQQVNNRIPSVAKTVTARYTLDELLGTAQGEEASGRSVIQQDLSERFGPELEEFGVQLLDIRVSNFAPEQSYLDLLREKANVGLEREIATQRTLQLQEQLKQEEAQTEIELERARRQNEVNQELSRVYDTSDRYFELERLRLLQGVVGDNDKIYFVPPGTDLTLILGGQNGQIIDTGDTGGTEPTP